MDNGNKRRTYILIITPVTFVAIPYKQIKATNVTRVIIAIYGFNI